MKLFDSKIFPTDLPRTKNMRSPRLIIYSLVTVAVAFTIGQTWLESPNRTAFAIESVHADADRQQLKHVRDLSAAFQEVTKSIIPSVVNIRSIRKVEFNSRSRRSPSPGRDPFERFFEPHLQPRNAPDMRPFVQRGLGSGLIVSNEGYIVTNNHVVARSDQITVALSDDRVFDAKVVGTDEKTDLAVLKISASDLTPAKLGDSASVSAGEWVLAMGNPFGLSQTVTAGIISAKGRANMGIAEYEDFIQTDAAINPGNSGGPLVNLAGQVIGINTAIASQSGGHQGVGFAIPSNMVKQIMDAIINNGKVVRGWLGVLIQDFNQDLANSFGFDGSGGVLVGDVVDDGPADQSGLEPGDIVVRFSGNDIETMNQFRNQIAATKPGERAGIEIVRSGKLMKFNVEIGELQSKSFQAQSPADPENLGMRLQNITPDVAESLRLKGDAQGVVVTQVESGGIAEKAGIRPGDIIIAMEGVGFGNLSELRSVLAQHDLAEGVRMRVKTKGMQRFVFLKL